MSFMESIGVAWASIRGNTLRSVLTMLGIIIGVAAVVALMGIGQGVQNQITSSITQNGTNLLTVVPGSFSQGGVRSGAGGAPTLTAADATAIADPTNCPFCQLVAPEVTRQSSVVYGSQNNNYRISGSTPDYSTIRNLTLAEGAWYTDSDVQAATDVAVIGANVNTDPFQGADQDESLRRELLQGVSSELQGMRRLLDDLIGLHNQESGHLELRRQLIDLGIWLPAMLSPWREAAQRKGLQWEIAIPAAHSLPAVAADPDRLAQAIGNLLSNAVKYTPGGGTIAVTAGSDGEGDWVQVRDTGPGIAAAEQEHIFEPFHRADAHLLYPEGMGLGLAITRDIVAAHGGRLTLSSVPGQGSTFTTRLPLAPA